MLIFINYNNKNIIFEEQTMVYGYKVKLIMAALSSCLLEIGLCLQIFLSGKFIILTYCDKIMFLFFLHTNFKS